MGLVVCGCGCVCVCVCGVSNSQSVSQAGKKQKIPILHYVKLLPYQLNYNNLSQISNQPAGLFDKVPA